MPYSQEFRKKIILGLTSYKQNEIIIKTGDDPGFYMISNNEVVRYNTNYDKFIDDNLFNTFTTTPNGEIVVGTKKTGIIILNSYNFV